MAEDAGVTITLAAPSSAAGIAAFRDQGRLLAALQAEFGADIPSTPRFVQTGALTLSCLAPTRYFATAPRNADLAARLSASLTGLAAVTDQSDLWACFAISGLRSRVTLARIVPIDLTPSKFRPGDLALTRAGHLDVRLWCVGEHSYEIAVARSYAEDLRYVLDKEASVPS
jgi:sarcosine oxidase subunit gamma